MKGRSSVQPERRGPGSGRLEPEDKVRPCRRSLVKVRGGLTPWPGLTAAMVRRPWRCQRFGLSLDFVQPAVQLPLVARGGFRLREGRKDVY